MEESEVSHDFGGTIGRVFMKIHGNITSSDPNSSENDEESDNLILAMVDVTQEKLNQDNLMVRK
jgi:hypothetical protein